MKHLSLLFLLVATLASGKVYDVDTTHSSLNFKVRHLFTKASGHFNDWNGKIDFDAARKKSPMKVDVAIKTASIDTANEKRDGHLRNADFFDVKKFPTITFKSTSAKAAGKNKYTVSGKLNMHGVTKTIAFKMEYLGSGPDGRGNTKAGFTGTAKVNRKDFGLVYNSAMEGGGLVLGNDVEITIEVEAMTKGKKS